MQIFVVHPRSEEGQLELRSRVAALHVEYAVGMVKKLCCPNQQKLQMMDTVIKHLQNKNKETVG